MRNNFLPDVRYEAPDIRIESDPILPHVPFRLFVDQPTPLGEIVPAVASTPAVVPVSSVTSLVDPGVIDNPLSPVVQSFVSAAESSEVESSVPTATVAAAPAAQPSSIAMLFYLYLGWKILRWVF